MNSSKIRKLQIIPENEEINNNVKTPRISRRTINNENNENNLSLNKLLGKRISSDNSSGNNKKITINDFLGPKITNKSATVIGPKGNKIPSQVDALLSMKNEYLKYMTEKNFDKLVASAKERDSKLPRGLRKGGGSKKSEKTKKKN